MVQVEEAKRPSSYEMIKAAIMGLVEQEPPARRAAIKRIEELGPERALAMLNSDTSDCTSDSPGSEKE